MRSLGVVIGVVVWSLWGILLLDFSLYELVVSISLLCIGASTFQILIILEKTEGRVK
jgi:hypothetical protein